MFENILKLAKEEGIIPAIRYGHMAAPRLTHVLETATNGGSPYPFHFKHTPKERGEIATHKANWKKEGLAKWKRKEFTINTKFSF